MNLNIIKVMMLSGFKYWEGFKDFILWGRNPCLLLLAYFRVRKAG